MTVPPNQYPRNGSRDFCNSFWGPGDDGVNVLLSRMRGAMKMTDEIKRFWAERALIEEQYAARLLALSKFPLGSDEVGELLNVMETLRKETEIQANSHTELAQAIRSRLETPTSHLLAKQANHRKNFQAPIEKKFKTKQTQESYVAKAREKYDGDCMRIRSYTQQSTFAQGKDLERVMAKLQRAQQTVQANEQDLVNFSQALQDLLPGWENDWKDYCDRSQDLEEDRMFFMLDTTWAYANEVSQLCVNDDQSCERIRAALEQFEPPKELIQFVVDYGTGNTIIEPLPFVPYDLQDPNPPQPKPVTHTRALDFTRVSRKTVSNQQSGLDLSEQYNLAEGLPEPVAQPPVPVNGDTHNDLPPPHQEPELLPPHADSFSGHPPPAIVNHQNSPGAPVDHSAAAPPPPPPPPQQPNTLTGSTQEDTAPTPVSHRSSQPPPTGPPSTAPPPLPVEPSYTAPPPRPASPPRQPLPTPQQQNPGQPDNPAAPIPPPQSQPPETGRVLFYVRALFDYAATIEEEFSFQAGDIIAVTATPDDGWWSGELLDEARKEEGRHVFPSNFVELF